MAYTCEAPMKVAPAGVDIGADSIAGARTTIRKQKARVDATTKRTRRTVHVARLRHTARRVGITGVQPALSYCHSAVGIAPSVALLDLSALCPLEPVPPR